MQCYRFEILRLALRRKLEEIGFSPAPDELDLADLLTDHGIESIEQLPDVVSLARNLQAGIPRAA